jgi:hypothetical protein
LTALLGLAGSKFCVNQWIPLSAPENAFLSPTVRELTRTSWVVAEKTNIPKAVRTQMAKSAAIRAKPLAASLLPPRKINLLP